MSVVLPNHPAGAVARHRPADFRRGGNSDAARPAHRDKRDVHEHTTAPNSGLQDLSKFVALPDPSVSAEAVSAPGQGFDASTPLAYFLGSQARPALGTAPFYDEPPSARSHPNEKAVGPSSATIVGLERSLHCFMESLRKVEPLMLSGIALKVKRPPGRGDSWGRWRVIVALSGAASFSPPAESFLSEFWG